MSNHKMHPYSNSGNGHPDANPENGQQPAQPDVSNVAPPAPEEELKLPDAATPPTDEAAQAGVGSPEELAKAEIEDMRLRMAAEMDNFKKRLTRDHQEQVRYAAEKVLADLLPALDNLDLAIQYGSTHEACKDMMQGIEMTRRQLLDAVAKNGLVSLGERGEPFDPARHEAIGVEAAPDVAPGAVSRVFQRGYKLHDRLLRPAKVMVNN